MDCVVAVAPRKDEGGEGLLVGCISSQRRLMLSHHRRHREAARAAVAIQQDCPRALMLFWLAHMGIFGSRVMMSGHDGCPAAADPMAEPVGPSGTAGPNSHTVDARGRLHQASAFGGGLGRTGPIFVAALSCPAIHRSVRPDWPGVIGPRPNFVWRGYAGRSCWRGDPALTPAPRRR